MTNSDSESDILDVESIICRRLIECGIANGDVYVSDGIQVFSPPAVFVTTTSITGDSQNGLWETTLVVSCSDVTEHAALRLSHAARQCLDGWGGNGIADVSHISTIPNRNTGSAPVIHTRAMTFRVLHQE